MEDKPGYNCLGAKHYVSHPNSSSKLVVNTGKNSFLKMIKNLDAELIKIANRSERNKPTLKGL